MGPRASGLFIQYCMLVTMRIDHGLRLLKPWGLHPCSENCLIVIGDLLHSFFDGSMEGGPSANVFGSSQEETPVIAYVGFKPEKSCMQTLILSASVGEACEFGCYFLFVLQGAQPEVATVPGKSAFDVLLQWAKEVTLPEYSVWRREQRRTTCTMTC